MISLAIFFKNLKLLFRSWASSLIVLVAPLLVVLLIGLSLSYPPNPILKIGISGNLRSELSQRILARLNDSSNGSSIRVLSFSSSDLCKRAIEAGSVSGCVFIPDNLSLSPQTRNIVDFYVDESRINLVPRVINLLSANIASESEEITKEIGKELISVLITSRSLVKESISDLELLALYFDQSTNTQDRINKELLSLEVPSVDINLSSLPSHIDQLNSYLGNLRHMSKRVIDTAETALANVNDTQLKRLRRDIQRLNEEWENSIAYLLDVSSLKNGINSAQTRIDLLREYLSSIDERKKLLLTLIEKLKADMKEEKALLYNLTQKQEQVVQRIDSFKQMDPNLIASPLKTNVVRIDAKNVRIIYFFPYLIMLIIEFVGLMLPSTLMLMEKKSKAFFRNLLTPVRLYFFTFMNYFSSLIIILFQLLIVFVVANLYLKIPLLENFLPTFFIVILTTTLFSLLGLFLGSFLNSFEGITMISLVLLLISLFLSNLVLPIESLAPSVQRIANLSPFVIGAESLRRSMLFGTSLSSLLHFLSPLLLYVAILFLSVVFSFRFLKSRALS